MDSDLTGGIGIYAEWPVNGLGWPRSGYPYETVNSRSAIACNSEPLYPFEGGSAVGQNKERAGRWLHTSGPLTPPDGGNFVIT